MFKPIALLAYPSLPTFLRRCESNAIFDGPAFCPRCLGGSTTKGIVTYQKP